MKKFNLNHYFNVIRDEEIISSEPFLIAQPKNEGITLITQYLHNKYQTNICHPIRYYDETYPVYIRFNVFSDIKAIKPYISFAQNQLGDYRQAFIIGERSHCMFMVYIKEGKKEAILYSDSRDTNERFVSKIHKNTGINVFTNAHLGPRQADHFSCYMDALVLGRDTTAFNMQTKQYRMKNLIGLLEKRVEKTENGVSYIRFPDSLLKTAQLSSFVDFHKEQNPTTNIHKEKTLSEFRNHYQKIFEIKNKGKKSIPTYLQQKGMKYTLIAQIQFYLNEIESEVGVLSKSQRYEFIVRAKDIAKDEKHTDLYRFAEELLNSLYAEIKVNQNQEASNIREQDDNTSTEKTGYSDEQEAGLFPDYWDEISENGSLSNAKILIHNYLLIKHLAEAGKLFKCAVKDAYFSKKLLLKYPHFFTERESVALQWQSQFRTGDSKLCIQDIIETSLSSSELVNREELINKLLLTSHNIEHFVSFQNEALSSRNLELCLLFFDVLYVLFQRKILSLKKIKKLADSMCGSLECLSESADDPFFKNIAHATAHQREDIEQAMELQQREAWLLVATWIKTIDSIPVTYEGQNDMNAVRHHENDLLVKVKCCGLRFAIDVGSTKNTIPLNDLHQKTFNDAIAAKENEIKVGRKIRKKYLHDVKQLLSCVKFNYHLNIIEEKTLWLSKKAKTNNLYIDAAIKASQLYRELIDAKTVFLSSAGLIEDNKSRFIETCNQAINQSRLVLEQHRGWKQVFADVVSVMVSLATIGISYAATGKFLLFTTKTDSAEKLNWLQQDLGCTP